MYTNQKKWGAMWKEMYTNQKKSTVSKKCNLTKFRSFSWWGRTVFLFWNLKWLACFMHAPKETVEDRKIYKENQESTKPKLLYPWPKYEKGGNTAGNPYNKVKAVGLYFILTTSLPWLLSLWHFLFFWRTAKLADKRVRETWILSFGLSAWSANTNENKNVMYVAAGWNLFQLHLHFPIRQPSFSSTWSPSPSKRSRVWDLLIQVWH